MSFINLIEITPVSFPIVKPFSNHVRKITHLNGLVIKIFTDSGIVGHSIMYGLSNISYDEVINYIKNDLILYLLNSHEIVDSNTLNPYWNNLWSDYKYQNTSYEKLYALAAVDIAVWDIFTKSKNISLHQYLGAAQAKIPVYGTTGWLSFSLPELIEECQFYAEKVINAFKIRIGHDDDYLRIEAIREVMGNDFVIMLDANQRYSVEEALCVADKLSEFNITWIEEPTNNLLDSIRKINKSRKVPVAIGENIINESEFITICTNKLTDYLQPDIPRCGGITGFFKVIQIASQYHLPVCNHLMYELSASLIAASPNGYMLEYDNFLPPGIFTADFSVKNGHIQIPSNPGTGVEITEQALKKYSVGSYTFHPASSMQHSFLKIS